MIGGNPLAESERRVLAYPPEAILTSAQLSEWLQVSERTIESWPLVTDVVQSGGWTWRGVLVWDKGVGRPVRGRFRNHLEFLVWASHGSPDEMVGYPSALISMPTVHPSEREHLTQKPVELVAALLDLCPHAGTVLDPFIGSGTTLRAAKDCGWGAIGIDVDERHCETAARRMEQEVLGLGGVA